MRPAPIVPALSDAARRFAMTLSVIEGVLYALMVGFAETYFVADAVRLGASPLELGLVIALPLLTGALASLLALRLLAALGRRRPLVALAAFGQALTLLALALLQYAHALTPVGLLALLCVYQVTGQAAGIAWSSWYGDLVPVAVRGRYFARRTRLVHLATFLGLVGGGLLLQELEPATHAAVEGGGMGFALLFLIGGTLRLFSAALLARSPEPRFTGLPPASRALRFLATARGRNAWRLVVGGATFHASVYLASPYFAPFMLDEVRLSYLGYMIAVGSQTAAKVVGMPFWGRVVDRSGARAAYSLAILLAALIPLPWLWIDALPGIVLAQICSGIAWGGYEMALFAFALESTVQRTRPLVFTAQNLVNGLGQVSGSFLGAGLLGATGYRTIFAISLGARLLVALCLPRVLRELRPRPAPRPLLLRMVGFRPDTGPMHRPIPEPRRAADPAP
jgi:MFS family permease